MYIITIKKSAEFKEISDKGHKFHSKTILVLANKTPEKYFFNQEEGKNAKEFCRVGYTVSKKVGNAVVRNKIKRRFRAAFLHLTKNSKKNLVKNQCDYILIAKKEVTNLTYRELLRDLEYCVSALARKIS